MLNATGGSASIGNQERKLYTHAHTHMLICFLNVQWENPSAAVKCKDSLAPTTAESTVSIWEIEWKLKAVQHAGIWNLHALWSKVIRTKFPRLTWWHLYFSGIFFTYHEAVSLWAAIAFIHFEQKQEIVLLEVNYPSHPSWVSAKTTQKEKNTKSFKSENYTQNWDGVSKNINMQTVFLYSFSSRTPAFISHNYSRCQNC